MQNEVGASFVAGLVAILTGWNGITLEIVIFYSAEWCTNQLFVNNSDDFRCWSSTYKGQRMGSINLGDSVYISSMFGCIE